MKKIITLLLIIALLFTMCACKKEKDDDDDNEVYVRCLSCNELCDESAAFCAKCGAPISNKANVNNNNNNNNNNSPYDPSLDDYLGTGTSTDDSLNSDSSSESGEEDSSQSTEENWEDEYKDVDCFECHDAGYSSCQGHECYMCSGEGSRKCGGCKGSGSFGGLTCFACSGEGETNCFTCSGTGKIYHKFDELDNYTTVKCTECDNGNIQCSVCKGSGRYSTGSAPSYGGNGDYTYDKICYNCSGKKTELCTACGGDGERLVPKDEQ